MAEHVVAKAADIPAGEARVVDAGGTSVALFNVNGQFRAISNICLHRGGPLGEGALDGTVVTCPWHGWQVDVETGEVQHAPGRKVACYAVRVDGDQVKVTL